MGPLSGTEGLWPHKVKVSRNGVRRIEIWTAAVLRRKIQRTYKTCGNPIPIERKKRRRGEKLYYDDPVLPDVLCCIEKAV